ncbi:MAG: glycosyltransferase, partial [Thermoproteus sp.]|nr:glycosyltransferase [Thermoproteus sp.]
QACLGEPSGEVVPLGPLEGEEVYREAVQAAEDVKDVHLLMLPPDSHVEVNAFQRASAVVFQKSIREGFGLVVSEALWKERPVVGGNAGGIRVQIIHGVNGFLVETPEEAAYYALYLLKNEDVRRRMGVEGREHVRRNFLITHHIRRYLMAVLYLAKRTRPAS